MQVRFTQQRSANCKVTSQRAGTHFPYANAACYRASLAAGLLATRRQWEAAHTEIITDLKARHADKIAAARSQLQAVHDEDIEKLHAQHLAELEEMVQNMDVLYELGQQRDGFKSVLADMEEQKNEVEDQRDMYKEALHMAEAVIAEMVCLLCMSLTLCVSSNSVCSKCQQHDLALELQVGICMHASCTQLNVCATSTRSSMLQCNHAGACFRARMLLMSAAEFSVKCNVLLTHCTCLFVLCQVLHQVTSLQQHRNLFTPSPCIYQLANLLPICPKLVAYSPASRCTFRISACSPSNRGTFLHMPSCCSCMTL